MVFADKLNKYLLVSVPNPDCTVLGVVGKLEGIARIAYHFVCAWVVVLDGPQETRAILVEIAVALVLATAFPYGGAPHCTVRKVAAGPVPFELVALNVNVQSVLFGILPTSAYPTVPA